MRLGLIAGTVLYGAELFEDAETVRLETAHGPAVAVVGPDVAYVPRHGLDPDHYILPHRINHPANLAALKSLGVELVVGLNSSGSLKESLPPETIVIPDDYISLADPATVFADRPVHITPVLSAAVRDMLIRAAEKSGRPVVDRGVYWQSRGPRLETKAEINLVRHFADCIGMTLGSEASVAQELGLEYASLCSIDNYGHGLCATPLSEEQIWEGAGKNRQNMLAIFEALVDIWREERAKQ